MSSSLDDPDANLAVVMNEEQRYRMWLRQPPPVWTVVHGSAAKDDRVSYVRGNRTEMREVSA